MASLAAVDPVEAWMAGFAGDVVRYGFDAPEVDALWPDKLGCLIEACAAFTRKVFTDAASAFMAAGDDRPLALHQALAATLEGLAGAPGLTSMSVVALPCRGDLTHTLHLRMIALFGELLDTGRGSPEADLAALFVGGAIWQRVRRHAAAGTLGALHLALPALSWVALTTVYGREEALRVRNMLGLRP